MNKTIKTLGVITAGVGTSIAVSLPLILKKGKVSYVHLEQNKIIQKSNSKHYFMIMADSMASFKMQAVLQKEKLEEEFKGWRLNMNVVTSGYGTETGLPAVVGGAKYNPVLAQANSKKQSDNVTEAYDSFFSDLSNSTALDKIYVSNPEYYKTAATSWFGSRDIKDPKNKISYIDATTRDNVKVKDFKMIANQVKANENNFTYMVSDIAHRNDYGGYYSKDGGGLVNALRVLTNTLKERKMYDDSTILVVSDHGRPMENNSDFQGTAINEFRKNSFVYKEYSPSGGKDKISDLASPSFEVEVKHFSDSLSPMQESVVENMSGMFYKPFRQKDSKINYNSDTLWASYDARSVVYHDLNINGDTLKFNLNKSGKFNNQSLNGFIDDPMNNIKMKTRRLISFNKNHSWGIHDSVHYGKDAIVWSSPFFEPNINTIERYIFEKMDFKKGEKTLIEKKTIAANNIKQGKGQIEFEKFIDGFINKKKIT